MKPLVIAGRKFSSRLFVGTGKFSGPDTMREAMRRSKTELATVALRRVEPGKNKDGILSDIDDHIVVALNTSGARTAEEALRVADFAEAAGTKWIKLEIHPDPHHLLPDPVETLSAAGKLVERGFVVLPYINADPVLAKRLEEVGVHAVMPLGAPIGTNRGIETRAMLEIIIANSLVPVVVDAGLGAPSHAAEAIEMGADAVLVNTAIAAAGDPGLMAEAFADAVAAAEKALEAVPPPKRASANPTSPMEIF
jgi:thiazole synthase